MDSIKKKIFCEELGVEREVTYYFMEINGSFGLNRKKVIYYDCACKRYCDKSIHYNTCPCFKEWVLVEEEINKP
jgi:hypothetical protein